MLFCLSLALENARDRDRYNQYAVAMRDFLELPWILFSESGKRFGRDITLSVYFEEARSLFRDRFVLILQVKTERS